MPVAGGGLTRKLIDEVCVRVEKFLDPGSVECRVMRAICNDPEACPLVELRLRVINTHLKRSIDLADLMGWRESFPAWVFKPSASTRPLVVTLSEESVLVQGIEVPLPDDAKLEEWLQGFLSTLIAAFDSVQGHEFYGSTDEPRCIVDTDADSIILAGGAKLE